MGNVKKTSITFDRFKEAIDIILYQIKERNVRYNYIIGLTRGGLIPATVLSHKLDVPMLASNWATDRKKPSLTLMDILDNPRNKVLLVDEILDSGKTISSFMNIHGKTDVAVLIWNKEQEVVPEYYAFEIERSRTSEWFEFWWEV
jgi:hypoxanthine phosphoribosyltransferase